MQGNKKVKLHKNLHFKSRFIKENITFFREFLYSFSSENLLRVIRTTSMLVVYDKPHGMTLYAIVDV